MLRVLLGHFTELLQEPMLHGLCIGMKFDGLLKLPEHSLPNLNERLVREYERCRVPITGRPPGEPRVLYYLRIDLANIPRDELPPGHFLEFALIRIHLIILDHHDILLDPPHHLRHGLLIKRKDLVGTRPEPLKLVQYEITHQIVYDDDVHGEAD